MEISEQTILELVKSQGTLTQAVTDVKDRFDKALPYLMDQDTANADAIRSVERKIWYFGGVGTALGFVVEHLGGKYVNSIFGGK